MHLYLIDIRSTDDSERSLIREEIIAENHSKALDIPISSGAIQSVLAVGKKYEVKVTGAAPTRPVTLDLSVEI